MRFIRTALAVLVLAAALPLVHAQSLAVNATWIASANSTASDPGVVQVYRATGTCAANPVTGATYKELDASAPPAGPYQDATVTDGQTYAYYLTATTNSYSLPSNPSACAQVTVVLTSAPAAPTGLTLTVTQVAGTAAVTAATTLKRPAPPTLKPR